jgi:hypothetical protein
MTWLDRFKATLNRFVSRKTQKDILGKTPLISAKSSAARRAEWIKATIDRLDALVPDEETRREILLCCSDRFPKTRIQILKEELHRLGNIDALLEYMHKDDSWGGLSYYEYPKREGSIIYVTKIPYSPKKYKAATTEEEKRRAYCHCGWVRATNEPISKTFCYCGSGWYKTLWEGILEQPVKVEIVTTVASGDADCTFAIHLPPNIKI